MVSEVRLTVPVVRRVLVAKDQDLGLKTRAAAAEQGRPVKDPAEGEVAHPNRHGLDHVPGRHRSASSQPKAGGGVSEPHRMSPARSWRCWTGPRRCAARCWTCSTSPSSSAASSTRSATSRTSSHRSSGRWWSGGEQVEQPVAERGGLGAHDPTRKDGHGRNAMHLSRRRKHAPGCSGNLTLLFPSSSQRVFGCLSSASAQVSFDLGAQDPEYLFPVDVGSPSPQPKGNVHDPRWYGGHGSSLT
jgi:hypothetical protein